MTPVRVGMTGRPEPDRTGRATAMQRRRTDLEVHAVRQQRLQMCVDYGGLKGADPPFTSWDGEGGAVRSAARTASECVRFRSAGPPTSPWLGTTTDGLS